MAHTKRTQYVVLFGYSAKYPANKNNNNKQIKDMKIFTNILQTLMPKVILFFQTALINNI